jgi:hypothetical protein
MLFVASAFISPLNTNNAYEVKWTQQHCYVFPKNLTPWWDSVPEADGISTAPRRQGKN